MNFINAFEELDKLYEEASAKETLTEGRIIDTLKKLGTRLGADVATIVRTFAECGPDALSDLAYYVENKAVLKALQSGNEKVLNTLTKDDIEELKQDIEEYDRKRAAKKAGTLKDDTLVDEEATIEESCVKEDFAEHDVSVQKSKGKNQWFAARFNEGNEIITAIIVAPNVDEATKRLNFNYPKASNIDIQEQPVDQKTVERLRAQENAIFVESLEEAADEAEIVEPELPVDDVEIEIVDDEPKQHVIECNKCGALVIVDEVEVDEESDLVNVKDKCKFCEEKEGYKIIGSIIPYEEAVEVAPEDPAEDDTAEA